MILFNAHPSDVNFTRRSQWLLCAIPASMAFVFVLSTLGIPRTAMAECCGDAAAPAPTQTYRLDFQTVYDEQQLTAYRVTYETVYDARVYTVTKPVWETQTSERRYTVQRPVWETSTREERTTVTKPVYETHIRDMSYDVTRDVVETGSREERFTVMKPVYETSLQQQTSVVRRPVYETSERDEAYTVAEPVTTMRTTYADQGGYVDQVTPMVSPSATQLGFVPAGWAVNPSTGLMAWQRGGYVWTVTPGVVMNQVNRVYQPSVVAVQVPQTTVVNRIVTRKVPVQTVRYVDEQVVQQVPVQTMRMVAEEQVRQVPVQVCKIVSEDRVEPVSVQVCKYVSEQRTAQVPRIVETKVPYTYSVRSPRTVVMRVPLDACGNPLPSVSLTNLPSATAKPITASGAPGSAATSPPALVPTDPPLTKTFSDKPADAQSDLAPGWKDSSLDHIDPSTQSGEQPAPARTFRAEKSILPRTSEPSAGSGDRSIETIPAPAAKQPGPTRVGTPTDSSTEPAVAPLGPAVEPAPPAIDPKDVPTAEVSGLNRATQIESAQPDQSI